MLLKEEIIDAGGDDLLIRKTFDVSGAKARAAQLAEQEAPMSDSRAVGVVPGFLLAEWLREAGVAYDDPAAEDVIRRKLMSGEFEKLRPWTGSF